MQKVPLAQEVAEHLEEHMRSIRLEIVVGNVPTDRLGEAEELLRTRLHGAEKAEARIEGSLACLEVSYQNGETRFFPLRVADARALMNDPLKQSRIFIEVGAGIIINQCHQTGNVEALPRCSASDAFLTLVRRG